MNEPPTLLLGQAVADMLRGIIREELKCTGNGDNGDERLLTPEELAKSLNVPRSWVYEQSRQGRIPTVRLGRYVRFNLKAVIAAQQEDSK